MREMAFKLKKALLENLPDGITPEDLNFRFYESNESPEAYFMIEIKNQEEKK